MIHMLISTLAVVRIAVLFLLIIVFVFPKSMAQTTTTTATTESFWTSGAPMPTPRTEVTAAVLEDDIYVIGGFDESPPMASNHDGQTMESMDMNNNSGAGQTQMTNME